jgi:hypothetical protein
MKIDAKKISEISGIGVVELSRQLGLSRGAISQWDIVPTERVIALCRLIEWKLTPHQLRPDIYPNPTDGLPPDRFQIYSAGDCSQKAAA